MCCHKTCWFVDAHAQVFFFGGGGGGGTQVLFKGVDSDDMGVGGGGEHKYYSRERTLMTGFYEIYI